MRRAPPDVLFVPSHVLPLVLPASSVVVIYDVGHRFVPRAHGALDWLYLEWAIRRHVRLATRLITISQSTRRDLVRLYGADPARIDVAYPAADARFTRASAEEVARVRARYGLGTRYVLHLGTIKPRKNLPRLIQGFARSGLAADTQLALGGMTTYGGPAVERAISDARLGGRLVRLGYVPDADLPALYSGAAAVAIVSLYEGFGMPAVEAMACGATVVASDRGSLPEIVGEAGILVDPLDVGSIAAGLRRAVDDTWFGARGLRRAADFSWRAAALKARSSLDSAYSASVDTAARSRSRSVAS
jgi:glycosyltransferase involved in cell wall biosynthesis